MFITATSVVVWEVWSRVLQEGEEWLVGEVLARREVHNATRCARDALANMATSSYRWEIRWVKCWKNFW